MTPFISGIIWDVDGTLADTLDLCISALGVAITRYGGPQLTPDEIRGRFGPTEEGVLRNEVGDAWQDAMELYLAEYQAGHGGAHFPTVNEVVRMLGRAGIRQAVVTGKGARSAAITLEAIDLADVFEEVAAGSMDGSIKTVEIARIVDTWGLAPPNVAYIGDAPSDIRHSREANVVAVAAAWKPGIDAEHLSGLDPDFLLTSESELVEWVEQAVEFPS